MADSTASDDVAAATQSQHSSSALRRDQRKSDDLDERQTPTLAGWQLREQLKSNQPSLSLPDRKPIPRGPRDLGGDVDPSLPPAFRAAFARQRKKDIDDFMSMDSVHSTKTQLSTLLTAAPSSNGSDTDESESTFDGHDSFASLGEDDEDDEAYREGRNQIARQAAECSRPTSLNILKNNDFKLKKGGVNGKPLDFIAE
jgi:hypothetical protein